MQWNRIFAVCFSTGKTDASPNGSEFRIQKWLLLLMMFIELSLSVFLVMETDAKRLRGNQPAGHNDSLNSNLTE